VGARNKNNIEKQEETLYNQIELNLRIPCSKQKQYADMNNLL